MRAEKMLVPTVDPDGKEWYRVGGISALVLGVAYLLIIPLFASVGFPPTGGEAWLKYLDGKTTVWWAILGLSVLTDVLFVPVSFALYLALKGVNRNMMLVATAFAGLFILGVALVVRTPLPPETSSQLPGSCAPCVNDAEPLRV